jgi:hypothetical protein
MISKANIGLWSKVVESLPASKLIFTRKALSQILPTASNLVRWKRNTDPLCHQCSAGLPQTNKHVLSNCSSEVALKRYTKRHDDILLIIIGWLKSVLPSNHKLFADLTSTHCLPICDIFTNVRPDIAICFSNNVAILELTVCHETNISKSRNYKSNKYGNIAQFRKTQISQSEVSLFTFEVSTLGFISDISEFLKTCKLPKLPTNIKSLITKAAISNSYSIYCNRNNSDVIVNNM